LGLLGSGLCGNLGSWLSLGAGLGGLSLGVSESLAAGDDFSTAGLESLSSDSGAFAVGEGLVVAGHGGEWAEGLEGCTVAEGVDVGAWGAESLELAAEDLLDFRCVDDAGDIFALYEGKG
jgi:hypothetical protein